MELKRHPLSCWNQLRRYLNLGHKSLQASENLNRSLVQSRLSSLEQLDREHRLKGQEHFVERLERP